MYRQREELPSLIDQARHRQSEAKNLASRLLNGDYVFLDTETTGVTNNDEIINMAFINKDEIMEYNEYYRPSVPVSQDALDVSGITNEQLENERTFPEKWDDFKKKLNGRRLAIYNENFDERMLRNTCTRYGIPKKEVDEIMKDAVCTMHLYGDFADLKVWIKMEEACHAADINIEQNHLADGDVLMMVKLVKYIADPDTHVSARSLYDNLLDKTDDPNYLPKKQKNIADEISRNTIQRFKDNICDSMPADNEQINRMILKSYNYDIPLNIDGHINRYIKEKIFYGVRASINEIKQEIQMKKVSYRTYERRQSIKELYNRGYSISRIAKAKEMNFLEAQMQFMDEFSRDPSSMDLSQFVNPEYTDEIVRLSKELDTGTKTKPIKQKLPYIVDYLNINIVLAYYEKGMLDELKEKSRYNYYDVENKKLIAVKNIHENSEEARGKNTSLSENNDNAIENKFNDFEISL